MLGKSPNPAHLAIAECAERLKGEGRRLRVITQVRKQPLGGKGKNAAFSLSMKTVWYLFDGDCPYKKIFREKPSLQNIDELHTTAGTKNLLELHGSLFRVRCIDCGEVILDGTGLPIKITPFLLHSGALELWRWLRTKTVQSARPWKAGEHLILTHRLPEYLRKYSRENIALAFGGLQTVHVKDLPRCQKPTCGGLLRPHVVWFGENLDEQVKQVLEL